METNTALTNYYKFLRDNGRSEETIRGYNDRLRYFAREHPELPTDTATIEQFLKVRKETPTHRGIIFKILQAFYSYLERTQGITSPVPSKGKVGRPSRRQLIRDLMVPPGKTTSELPVSKLVQGGQSVSISTSISTAQMVGRFLESRLVAGRHRKTLIDYRTPLYQFTRQFTILPLKYEPIGKWLYSLNIVQRSRFNYRQHIKVFYHWLETEVLKVDQLFKWPVMEKGEPQRRVLETDELQKLMAGCHTFQEKCLVRTIIDTKARRGEILSMTRERIWSDHAIVDGKTGERTVYLNPHTYEMLCQLTPAGDLFQVGGQRMKGDYLTHFLRDLMIRCGFRGKKLGPHMLRHSAAVQHLIAGGDLESLRDELGHTNIGTTSIYAHLATQHVRQKHQDLDVIGRLAGEAEKPPVSTRIDEKTGTGVGVVSNILPTPGEPYPTDPCPSCHGMEYWRRPTGGWVCSRCHPNPNPPVTLKFVTLDQVMSKMGVTVNG